MRGGERTGLPLMTKVMFPVIFNAESEAAKPCKICHNHLLLISCL